MAKLTRTVNYCNIPCGKKHVPLTEEEVKKWKSEDEDLQDEVMDEVEFDLSHDKALEDSDWPELIEDE